MFNYLIEFKIISLINSIEITYLLCNMTFIVNYKINFYITLVFK